jgi:hypothetical protein
MIFTRLIYHDHIPIYDPIIVWAHDQKIVLQGLYQASRILVVYHVSMTWNWPLWHLIIFPQDSTAPGQKKASRRERSLMLPGSIYWGIAAGYEAILSHQSPEPPCEAHVTLVQYLKMLGWSLPVSRAAKDKLDNILMLSGIYMLTSLHARRCYCIYFTQWDSVHESVTALLYNTS